MEGNPQSFEVCRVYVCTLRPEDSGCTWLPLGPCASAVWTFSHIRSLCFEKHGSHPFLILSQSETLSLAKYSPRPAPLSSALRWCHSAPSSSPPHAVCHSVVLLRLCLSQPVSSLRRRHHHGEGFHLLRLHGCEAAVWQHAVSYHSFTAHLRIKTLFSIWGLPVHSSSLHPSTHRTLDCPLFVFPFLLTCSPAFNSVLQTCDPVLWILL